MTSRFAFVAGLLLVEAVLLLHLWMPRVPLPAAPMTIWAEMAMPVRSGGLAARAVEEIDVPLARAPRRRDDSVGQLRARVWSTGDALPGYAIARDRSPLASDSAALEPTHRALILSLPPQWLEPRRAVSVERRPPVLPVLYASFATLQVLDAVSTWRAVQFDHARELNPLVTGVADNLPALIAMKVGSTAVSIYAVEKLRKRNRKAAVATMIGINVAYAYVVARNLEVSRATRSGSGAR